MKNIRLSVLFFLLLWAGSGTVCAQTLVDQIEKHFSIFTTYPQEKLYLHLDKPYYAAGENIFFKAYLTEAIRHTSKTQSNFIYIELINAGDVLVLRKKIKRNENGFQGSLTLAPEFPAGNYYIRAYTHWMQNLGKEYFYSRSLRIGNALDRSVTSDIFYTVSEESRKCQTTIRFIDEYKQPMKQIAVAGLILENGKKSGSFSRKTNDQGEVVFDLPVNKSFKNRSVEVVFKDAVYNYSRTFFVPALGSEKEEFALSLFPEGGDLLAGCKQRVAFKAQKSDGTSCELQGLILDEKGDTITTFKTEHNGMGVFNVMTSYGSNYVVRATSDGTVYRTFAFPEIKQQGQQLSVVQRKNMVLYSILSTPETSENDSLYLVVHTRGRLAFIAPLNTGSLTGRFSGDKLGEGINEILLVGKRGDVLSRRLVFKAPDRQLELSAGTLPSLSGKRQKVSIPLNVTNKQGSPVQGTFSVSLTDRNLVVPDSLSGGIHSYFLLTSDLKGHVENPGYYFSSPSPKLEAHTDLLMLTHGWTRFRSTSLSELPTIHLDYFMEGGQFISGKTVNLVGSKLKNTPVMLMAPAQNITALGQSDENGLFLFENLQFKDSVMFVAQARAKLKMIPAFLKIDSVPAPAPYNKTPHVAGNDSSLYQEYDKATGDSYIEEGGMRVIRLNEVTVTARKKDIGSRGIYDGMTDYVYDQEFIEERLGNLTAFQAIQRLPGIRFDGANVVISGQRGLPLYIIDDMRYEDGQDIVMAMNALDLKSIAIVKGVQTSILGPDATGGAIIIKLKSGTDIKREASPGLVLFSLTGYSDSMEFYHPVYETPQQKENPKKDIRSTVYWNPNLQTDENGKALIEFYTPDNVVSPHLSIEGILEDGMLLDYFQ